MKDKQLKDTAKGAAAGALIGSIIPVVGTILGAAIGGYVGNRIEAKHSIKEHVSTWHSLSKTKFEPVDELGHIQAGRDAEILLQNIVETHYQFRGCHSFSSKRVPTPSKDGKGLDHPFGQASQKTIRTSDNHQPFQSVAKQGGQAEPVGGRNDDEGHGKYEIDIIVVTDKRLYILECKDWSGELFERNGFWVQRRRDGSESEGENLVHWNQKKVDAVRSYLLGLGISIITSEFQQKVMFRNQGLKISSDSIINNPNVVIPNRLIGYLSKQNPQLEPHQRFFSSIISILLEEEVAGKIIDGLFDRLGGDKHKSLIREISKLKTWDHIHLYGSRVITGDIVKYNIFSRSPRTHFNNIGTIKVNIVRNKAIGLVKALTKFGRPIGLDVYDCSGSLSESTVGNPQGTIKILTAGAETNSFKNVEWAKVISNPIQGKPDLIEIPLPFIDKITFGKCG